MVELFAYVLPMKYILWMHLSATVWNKVSGTLAVLRACMYMEMAC